MERYPQYNNGERLYIVISKLLENMQLDVLNKAKLANASLGEGNYNPNDIEAEAVFTEVLLLANNDKVPELIKLLKELPKASDNDVPRFYIDGVEVDIGRWFNRMDNKVYTCTGRTIQGWEKTLR